MEDSKFSGKSCAKGSIPWCRQQRRARGQGGEDGLSNSKFMRTCIPRVARQCRRCFFTVRGLQVCRYARMTGEKIRSVLLDGVWLRLNEIRDCFLDLLRRSSSFHSTLSLGHNSNNSLRSLHKTSTAEPANKINNRRNKMPLINHFDRLPVEIIVDIFNLAASRKELNPFQQQRQVATHRQLEKRLECILPRSRAFAISSESQAQQLIALLEEDVARGREANGLVVERIQGRSLVGLLDLMPNLEELDLHAIHPPETPAGNGSSGFDRSLGSSAYDALMGLKLMKKFSFFPPSGRLDQKCVYNRDIAKYALPVNRDFDLFN